MLVQLSWASKGYLLAYFESVRFKFQWAAEFPSQQLCKVLLWLHLPHFRLREFPAHALFNFAIVSLKLMLVAKNRNVDSMASVVRVTVEFFSSVMMCKRELES
jgi:hypothetical protein